MPSVAMQIDDVMIPSQPAPVTLHVASLFIDHDDGLEEALDLMVRNRVTTLPVLGRQGDVVGAVSYFDVLCRLRPTANSLGSEPEPPQTVG